MFFVKAKMPVFCRISTPHRFLQWKIWKTKIHVSRRFEISRPKKWECRPEQWSAGGCKGGNDVRRCALELRFPRSLDFRPTRLRHCREFRLGSLAHRKFLFGRFGRLDRCFCPLHLRPAPFCRGRNFSPRRRAHRPFLFRSDMGGGFGWGWRTKNPCELVLKRLDFSF
jgi:hypothetical protein